MMTDQNDVNRKMIEDFRSTRSTTGVPVAQEESHHPILNIIGKKVALGPIRKDLIDLHYQ